MYLSCIFILAFSSLDSTTKTEYANSGKAQSQVETETWEFWQTEDSTFIIIYNLVNDDVVSINLKLGELLHQSLCFIERKELGDANTNKSSQVLQEHRHKHHEHHTQLTLVYTSNL